MQSRKTVCECPKTIQLIESFKTLDGKDPASDLGWIPYSEFTDIESIESSSNRTIYRAKDNRNGTSDETVMLLLLPNDESIHEFARIYSLPTHKYKVSAQFRRYSTLLERRNEMILGFTSNDNNCYLVAKMQFYHTYSLYGFCSGCGILRCSPIWCACGHKGLSDTWTSKNKKLDELIRKSQIQTTSADKAYLEWLPFDWFSMIKQSDGRSTAKFTENLPTSNNIVLIPLDISDETDDSYYEKLCDDYQDILDADTWLTIGFTYNPQWQKYALVRLTYKGGLCLACTGRLPLSINAFCLGCRAPRPLDWTTGNKSLDDFIMKSWKNVNTMRPIESYIQWIEYNQLINVEEASSLKRGCTHVADWLQPIAKLDDGPVRVALKKIVNGQDAQSFDFHQLIEEYPEILTSNNIWIIGITREPSTGDYYLVFYNDVRTILDRFMRIGYVGRYKKLEFVPYGDFSEIEEIGSGGYGVVYTAKYKSVDLRVLKSFKNFNQTPELLVSEFRNHAKCSWDVFLQAYGITQHPETKEYMLVTEYASDGNLWSYLDRNINKLTWRMKLEHLRDIAYRLHVIHMMNLIHCDLHGGNIVLNSKKDGEHVSKLFICDLGLSKSVDSSVPNSAIQGVLPYIAPEVFQTHKFSQKSDIYAFGILAHQIASGEPPFRNRPFDEHLARDICNGLRPTMPDSAPASYRDLAEKCCDSDAGKRPTARELYQNIDNLIEELDSGEPSDDTWNTIYHSNNEPLLRAEKESKYSSKLLPMEIFSNSNSSVM